MQVTVHLSHYICLFLLALPGAVWLGRSLRRTIHMHFRSDADERDQTTAD